MTQEEILPLFTYGSLMQNLFNYEKHLRGKTVGSAKKARIKGQLFHLTEKGYPALLKGLDWVYGELFELKDFTSNIEELDVLEGFSQDKQKNEYNREKHVIEIFNEATQAYDQTTSAYVYFYAVENDTDFLFHRLYLAEGNWRAYYETVK